MTAPGLIASRRFPAATKLRLQWDVAGEPHRGIESGNGEPGPPSELNERFGSSLERTAGYVIGGRRPRCITAAAFEFASDVRRVLSPLHRAVGSPGLTNDPSQGEMCRLTAEQRLEVVTDMVLRPTSIGAAQALVEPRSARRVGYSPTQTAKSLWCYRLPNGATSNVGQAVELMAHLEVETKAHWRSTLVAIYPSTY